MAKEVFNRNVADKNIGEIETKNNTRGSVIGFWNQMADNIENKVRDSYANYSHISLDRLTFGLFGIINAFLNFCHTSICNTCNR